MSFVEADYLAERAGVTEVLRSLVDSPSDLDSTLQVILGNAVRLAHTDRGFIYLKDGELYRHVPMLVLRLKSSSSMRPTRSAPAEVPLPAEL